MTPSDEPLPSNVLPGMYTFSLNNEPSITSAQAFSMLTPSPNLPPDHPGANGGRYFTIQRVNGNGANGKNDGVSGGHQHTLEESDRVKKSSVQRHVLKEKKDRRTRSVCQSCFVLKLRHRIRTEHPRMFLATSHVYIDFVLHFAPRKIAAFFSFSCCFDYLVELS